MKPSIELIAHRGSSHLAPENTLAAFELGWQETTACECDIRSTRDGRLLVIHDDSTRRTTGVDLLVSDHTMAELQRLDAGSWKDKRWEGEKLPSLEESIAAIPEGKRFVIEIKSGLASLPELARVVRASGREAQLVMQTFSLETCVAVRRLLPNLSIYLLVAVKQNSESGIWTPTFSDIIAWAVGGGLNGIGVNDTCLLNREAVEAVHAAGLKLNIWTIDDPQAARRLIELGVDGLITNRPGWLRSALGI